MNQQRGDQQKQRRFAGVKRSGSVYGELQLREERFTVSQFWWDETGQESLLITAVNICWLVRLFFFLILSTNDIQRVWTVIVLSDAAFWTGWTRSLWTPNHLLQTTGYVPWFHSELYKQNVFAVILGLNLVFSLFSPASVIHLFMISLLCISGPNNYSK